MTRWRRFWLSVGIVVVSLGLLGPVGTTPVGASPAGTTPVGASPIRMSPAAEEPNIEITALATPILAPTDDLELTVTITNPDFDPVTINRLEIFSQTTTPTTAAQVELWMNGRGYFALIGKEDLTLTLEPGEYYEHTIRIDRANIAWSTGEYSWGPRGIEVKALTDDNRELTDRSMVIVQPDVELTPMPISVVLPVTFDTRAIQTLPTFVDFLSVEDEDDAEATPEDMSGTTLNAPVHISADTAEQIAAWQRDGVSLFVDPGLFTDQKVVATLQASETAAQSPVHLLPLYDADLAALAHTGQTASAEHLITESLTRADTTGINAVFDIALLVGEPDQETLALAHDLGAQAAIVPDSAMPLIQDPYYVPHAHTVTEVFDESLPVLITSEALNTAVSGALEISSSSLYLSGLDRRQVTLALSAVQYRELPNASRASVVVLGRDAIYASDAVARQETVHALLDAPWLTPTNISDLLTTVPDTNARYPLATAAINPGELNATDIDQLAQTMAEVDNFASIFDNAQLISNSAITHADVLFSVHWRMFPDTRSTQIAGLAPDPQSQTAIRVESSSTINMISESSALPINVTNRFDYPVTVFIHIEASDSRLHAPDPVQARLPENSTTLVSVPVEARGSGNLTVTVTVTNANGVPIGQSEDLDVRVRADWENVGTLVVAALFVALLVFGVVNSVRKGRRSEPIPVAEFSAAMNAGEDLPTSSAPKSAQPE
ncbi:MAG: hypothetical protein GX483_04575 [Actinomycetaceae bacterium]|nr:hypothetical protein [Actinomycetaceae bacterium]